MNDLKPKFELVKGQDFQKLWKEKEPLRKEICEFLQKQLDCEYGKLGLKLEQEERDLAQANKKLKANMRKANRLFTKQRKERDENIPSEKQNCQRIH